MSIQELVYKFKLEYDKLDSNDYPKVEIPQIILFLNKSQRITVEKAYNPDDNGKGFETDQLSIDDLEAIHIKNNPLLAYTLTGSNPNEYSIDLSQLTYEYLHLTRSYSYGKNDVCGTQILKNIQYTHNELNEVLTDPNRNPNFYWQEIPIVISQNKVFGYTDGTFSLTTGKLEYLRVPTQMDMAGYTHFDGTPSTNVDCEFPDYMQERILSLALMIAKGVVSDQFGVQKNANELQIQN